MTSIYHLKFDNFKIMNLLFLLPNGQHMEDPGGGIKPVPPWQPEPLHSGS